MPINDLEDKVNIFKNLSDWAEGFMAKKYGPFILGFSLIIGGICWGNYQYNNGFDHGKEVQAVKVESLAADKVSLAMDKSILEKKNAKLEKKLDSLSLTKIDVLKEATIRLEESRNFEQSLKKRYMTEKKDNDMLEKNINKIP